MATTRAKYTWYFNCSAAAQASSFAIWLIISSSQSDLHPLLFVEGLAGFLSLDQMLNLLQFLLSFTHGFINIDSRHFTQGVESSRSSRETSRIDSSGGSSESWSTARVVIPQLLVERMWWQVLVWSLVEAEQLLLNLMSKLLPNNSTWAPEGSCNTICDTTVVIVMKQQNWYTLQILPRKAETKIN